MSPAHAGMNRRFSRLQLPEIDVTRTRGDEPMGTDEIRMSYPCHPHTRG